MKRVADPFAYREGRAGESDPTSTCVDPAGELAAIHSRRIGIVLYDGPGNCEGPIVNAKRLLPEWISRGHKVLALIIRWGEESPAAEYLISQGVEVRVFLWPSDTRDQIRWILQCLSDFQPDLFVANYSVSGGFASRWIEEAGIPSVIMVRSDDELNWAVARQFVIDPSKWSVSGVVCVSHDLLDRIDVVTDHRVTGCCIPSGVPIPEHPLASAAPPRLVYVGRIEETQKRVHDVARVMCDVLEQLDDAQAVLIGEGSQRENVESYVSQRGLLHRAQLVGAVQPDELDRYLEGGSVALLLSDYEGTPGSLMDTMARGIVPICRNIPGGVQELVVDQHTGILTDDLCNTTADSIVNLLRDPETWQRLSLNARRQIIEDYSLESSVCRWERFIDELVEMHQPGGAIQIPDRIDLPPQVDALKPLDHREDPRWKRSLKRFERNMRNLRNRLMIARNHSDD